jgi:hypothetical protein
VPAARKNSSSVVTRRVTTAIVVVHGIGNHGPGRLRDIVGTSLERFLWQRNTTVTANPTDAGIELRHPRNRRRGPTEDRVVLMDVHWSSPLHRRSWRTLGWMLRSLPLLTAVALAPDASDFDDSASSMARVAYRIAMPLLVCVSLAQRTLWPALFVLAAAVVSLTAFRASNVIGDVVMAASDEERVACITSSINDAIDEALVIASRVIVVGHSQGGYLAHLALQRRTALVTGEIELFGVGSGLKPIALLRHFSDWRSATAALAGLVGVGLALVAVAAVPIGLLNTQHDFFDNFIPEATRSLIESHDGVMKPAHFHFGSAASVWHAVVPTIPQLFVFVAGVTLVATTAAWARPRLRVLCEHDLTIPDSVSRWTEVTSATDTVGRMAWPQLPDANCYLVPGVGNPLIDHISYFRPEGGATWLLAASAFPRVMRRAAPNLWRWMRYEDDRVRRCKSVATTLGLLALAHYALRRIDPSSHGLGAVIAQQSSPGWTFAGLLVLAAVGPTLALFGRWRLADALQVDPLPAPPIRTTISTNIRWVLFVVTTCFALMAYAATHYPLGYPNMSANERWMLHVAPPLMAGGLLAVAASLLAGFRPSTIAWTAITAPLMIVATYLPGADGSLMLFMLLGGFLVVTTTMILYATVGRPITWD